MNDNFGKNIMLRMEQQKEQHNERTFFLYLVEAKVFTDYLL